MIQKKNQNFLGKLKYTEVKRYLLSDEAVHIMKNVFEVYLSQRKITKTKKNKIQCAKESLNFTPDLLVCTC